MKKIEEAAREYDWTVDRDYSWESERPEQIKIDCFLAGARYVLDQLTSKAAFEAFGRGYAEHRNAHEPAETVEGCVLSGLAAVRKEIANE